MISENLLGDIFEECIPLFIALGDRTRLTILQCLFETQTTGEGRIPGLNVNEITDRTSLSRPAVSHHLKILKDTGLIDVLRKGVCNYYYLTNKSAIDKLGRLKEELEKYPESWIFRVNDPHTTNYRNFWFSPQTDAPRSGKAYLWTKFGKTAFGRLKQTAVGTIRKGIGVWYLCFFRKKMLPNRLTAGKQMNWSARSSSAKRRSYPPRTSSNRSLTRP